MSDKFNKSSSKMRDVRIPRARTLYVRNVPADLMDVFKSYCARRRRSMRSKIIALMKEAIAQVPK